MSNSNSDHKIQGLSARLRLLAESVISGRDAADVGTDHGLAAEYLLRSGICPRVIASDLRSGPLARARERLAGLPGAQLRLGGGLSVLEKGEVESVIIAGMGAELIIQILEEDPEKTRSFRRYVLQPRTRTPLLRAWLAENRFHYVEKLVREEDRICEVFAADVPQSSDGPLCAEPCCSAAGTDASSPCPCGTAAVDALQYELPLYPEADDLLIKDYVNQYISHCQTVLDELKNADQSLYAGEIGNWVEKLEFARLWAEKRA